MTNLVEKFKDLPLVFYLNGKRVEVVNPEPDQTLISFLRSNGIRLTGTKLGCGEGGCGACTVMISHYDKKLGKPVHRSINACLALLGSVEGTHITTVEGIGNVKDGLHPIEGTHITTVEGIGNVKDGLHPIQERISSLHGSQCGFCTPGIVMALYAFFREHPNATIREIEESLDGNLCRCTGYRPILDAAKTFASDAKTIANGYENTSTDSVLEEIKKDLPSGARVCPSSGKPCYCTVESSTEQVLAHAPPTNPKELIFPPALVNHEPVAVRFRGERSVWYRPLTLEDLLAVKAHHPEGKLIMGSSEATIESKFKGSKFPVLISPTHVPELNEITYYKEEDKTSPVDGNTGLKIGAAVTLTNLQHHLEELTKKRPVHETRTARAVLNQLRWFAGHQIRNAACLGGNIATASPISDLNPVWMAVGSVFTLASLENSTIVYRQVPANKFFIGYRKTEMKPNEIIYSITLPFNIDPLEFVEAYKQSRRREDDIAIVTAAFKVKLERDGSHYKVSEAGFSFGGMAPLTVRTPTTEAALKGRHWNKDTLHECYKHLEHDLPLAPNAPGGMIQYRRSLTTSFFFKFFCQVSSELKIAENVNEKDMSALNNIHRPISRGQQKYQVETDMLPVTAPIMHLSAKKQVTGEAVYIDDIKNTSDGLYSAFVMSTKAHARIVSINAENALAMPGVKGFYTAKDIPGDNDIGPVIHDEVLFATEKVLYHGHPIGIIVAETQQQAIEASRAVQIVYEDLQPIVTILDAIAENSFFESEKPQITRLQDGLADIEQAFKNCDHVVSAEMHMGGQEHFYLEPNVALAEPIEGDEMVIHSSTQNPTKTQVIVSKLLGVPQSVITVKTKRMGGGFGGKETRSIYVAAAAAVAAHKARRPVRLVLDRDVDMATSGLRHAFYAKYRVGFSSQGKIQALDVELYSLGGYSMDLSASVLHRAMFHIENAYYIPNLRVKGRVCRTNTPTGTAFRGFGGPQGMMFAENYIDQISCVTGIPHNIIRELNYYTEGQRTHYGQLLSNVNIQRIHKEILASSSWDQRMAAVSEFNQNNRWKKRGLAMVPVKFGMSFTAKFMNQAGALVHVYTDGSVLVTHGGTEMGQGLHTKMIQVAAQALKAPIHKVYISETSTDKIPNASPTAASASSDMYGMAILDACNQINKRLDELKARLGDKLTDHSFENLVRTAYFERIPLSATGFYATPNLDNFLFDGRPGSPFAYYTYGAAVAEVEIDVLTGDHQVLRSDVLMDIGNSLNPTIDIGQIEGAFVQGMGLFTIEEVVTLDNGYTFTRGPSTYKIPSFNDVPVDFRVTLLSDCPNPGVIHSSKGIGEPPLFLSASVFWAVKHAVYAARLDSQKERSGSNIAAQHAEHDHHESGKGLKYFRFDSPATCERIRIGCEDRFTLQFAPNTK